MHSLKENIIEILLKSAHITKEQLDRALIKQKENLENLRNEITPKIDEYQGLVTKNEKILKEITQKEQDIKDKIEEDNKLFANLDEKQRILKTKEIDISTREEELLRKEITLKNK